MQPHEGVCETNSVPFTESLKIAALMGHHSGFTLSMQLKPSSLQT